MIYLLNRFERKIASQYGDLYDFGFTLFRINYLLYSDTDFPYEAIISAHRIIMSKFNTRRIFLLKIGLYIGFIVFIMFLSSIIISLFGAKIYSSTLIQIPIISIVLLSISVLLSLLFFSLAIFSMYIFNRRTKQKYSVSFIIYDLIDV